MHGFSKNRYLGVLVTAIPSGVARRLHVRMWRGPNHHAFALPEGKKRVAVEVAQRRVAAEELCLTPAASGSNVAHHGGGAPPLATPLAARRARPRPSSRSPSIPASPARFSASSCRSMLRRSRPPPLSRWSRLRSESIRAPPPLGVDSSSHLRLTPWPARARSGPARAPPAGGGRRRRRRRGRGESQGRGERAGAVARHYLLLPSPAPFPDAALGVEVEAREDMW
ncbi:unnamed protein product [Urochloa humidicola]